MTIAVLPGGGTRWRLIGRTGSGADLLARVTAGRGLSWRAAMRRLRDGDGSVEIVAGPDGHYRWRLVGADGALIAESPTIFRDAQACRDALAAARQAADAVVGDSDSR